MLALHTHRLRLRRARPQQPNVFRRAGSFSSSLSTSTHEQLLPLLTLTRHFHRPPRLDVCVLVLLVSRCAFACNTIAILCSRGLRTRAFMRSIRDSPAHSENLFCCPDSVASPQARRGTYRRRVACRSTEPGYHPWYSRR